MHLRSRLRVHCPIDLSTYRPIDLSPYRPIALSTYRPIDLSTYRPIDLSTYRPIDLSTYRAALLLGLSLALACPGDASKTALDPLTEKPIAEEVAKTVTQAVVPPLPAGDPHLDALRARMAKLHQSQAECMKAMAEGKLRPFPDIHDAWPSFQTKTARISADTAVMETEKDPAIRATLAKGIFALLQEVGPFLQAADYLEQPPVPLTAAQMQEMTRLENAWNQSQDVPYIRDKAGNQTHLVILSPLHQYTIRSLAVELAFKAPPGSKIYVDAGDGGEFSNGLMTVELIAKNDGLASVLWVSHGRGVGLCEVGVRAPGLVNETPPFQIHVVKPVLEVPAYLNDAFNQIKQPADLKPADLIPDSKN